MTVRSMRRVLALLMALAAAAPPLAAQSVTLHVVVDPAASPVVGAIVRLIRGDSEVARGLTDGLGRVTLRAPEAGSYRLRIARIGWTEALTDPIEIPAGPPVRMTIPVSSARVELPTVVVRGNSPCRSDRDLDRTTTALWGEVQKALTAHLLSQASQLLHRREFVREVGLDRVPLREWVVASTLMRGPPFASLPAATLASDGFVQLLSEQATFASPDADLLLSPEFSATHCFRAVAGQDSLLGLQFEPIPGRRVSDVSGTLWVDRSSSELRHLEFSYTGLPNALRRAALGGRVEFSRLSSGAWIISYWHVRMPQMSSRFVVRRNQPQELVWLSGYLDQGGRAEVATDSTGQVDRAVLQGIVWDSLTGRAIEGATITVAGTGDSVRTGVDGRYSLAVKAAGEQVATVRHHQFVLSEGAAVQPVLLSLADTTRGDFSTPSLESVARALCRTRGAAVLLGMVRRADLVDAADHEVLAHWRPVDGSLQLRRARTRPKGSFALCDLPPNRPVVLQAVLGGTILVSDTVALNNRETRWIELREWGSIDSSSAALFTAESLDSLDAATDSAVILGSVIDVATGRGLPGATARISGNPDSTLSDIEGRFTISTSASGPQTLVVNHPSQPELRGTTAMPVVLSLGDTTVVEFRVVGLTALVQGLCGPRRNRSGIVGQLSDRVGNGTEGVTIKISWLTTNGYRIEERRTQAGGIFAFCDLPGELRLQIEARYPGGSVVNGGVRLTSGVYRWIELTGGQPE